MAKSLQWLNSKREFGAAFIINVFSNVRASFYPGILNIKLGYAPVLITAFREANKYSKRFVG
jgi:hypothetical protein